MTPEVRRELSRVSRFASHVDQIVFLITYFFVDNPVNELVQRGRFLLLASVQQAATSNRITDGAVIPDRLAMTA